MLINHKYQFIYLASPRTASTSIRTWLKDLDGSVMLDEHHRMHVPQECRGYFCWSTFRNPLFRAASLCAYHQQDPDARDWSAFVKDLPEMHPFMSRSQVQLLRKSGQSVRLIRFEPGMEMKIRDAVFAERGFQVALMPMQRLNGRTHNYLESATRDEVDSVLRHFADDWKVWQDGLQHLGN